MNIENFIKDEPSNAIPKIVDELGRVVIPIDFRRRQLENRRVVYMKIIKNYIILTLDDKDNIATKRMLDKLGRLTIFKEIREKLNIMTGDYMLIWTYKDSVILKREEYKCIFCEGTKRLTKHKGKFVCKNCLNKLNNNARLLVK